jgi:uncharacterized membrane protein YoaK (UPF0700 family)
MNSSPPTSIKTQARTAFTLAMVAGYVDAYGYITYSTYLSFMSGNTTLTGLFAGEGSFTTALPFFVSIVFFLFGVITGKLLALSNIHQSRRLMFLVNAILIAVMIGVTELGFITAQVHIATLSFAMGITNTLLSSIGSQSVNLTFVTGTLNRMANNIALAIKRAPLPNAREPWDTHWRRAGILARLWSAFFIGAFLEGATASHFGSWTLLLPVFILLGLALFNPAKNRKADTV